MTTPTFISADAFNAEIAGNATNYAASLFLGRGKYANAEAISLNDIREAAARLKLENPDCVREPIITAFDGMGNPAVISGKALKAAKPAKTPKAPKAEKPAKPAKVVKPKAEKVVKAKPVKATDEAKATAKAEKAKAAADAKAIKAEAAKAAKAAKPAKAPKPAKAAKEPKGERAPTGKRAEIAEKAAKGIVPAAPDFSAATHSRFRKPLAEVVALIEAKDIKGLKAFPIKPISSSPKALDKFRNLAVVALEAQAAAE